MGRRPSVYTKFDLEGFKKDFRALQTDDFDFSEVGTTKLSAEALFCLNYMADIEWSIGIYARNALVTQFALDPEFCEFLPYWMIEEYGHRDLFRNYLDTYCSRSGKRRQDFLHNTSPYHKSLIPNGQKLGWLTMGLLGNIAPISLEILYLSWGTVNEYLTASGYKILASKVECSSLQSMLRAIETQEYRHGNAYRAMANDRIHQHPSLARTNRILLERLWKMVGVGIRPSQDGRRVAQFLCQTPQDYVVLLRRDKTIGRIEGLDGINLLTRTAHRAGYTA